MRAAFLFSTPMLAASMALAGASSSAAVNGSLTDLIAARQASLDLSSITFRSMGDAIKAGRSAKSQAYAAAALAKWAQVIARMFPSGTGMGETPLETQARATVWADRAGFERAAARYADATAQLRALAQADDSAGFSRQLEVVNQACQACHSRYKQGDQSAPSGR